jgi:hypothetical protein
VVEQIGDFVEDDFEVLGLGLAAVNGRGHAARRTELFNLATLHVRAWERL